MSNRNAIVPTRFTRLHVPDVIWPEWWSRPVQELAGVGAQRASQLANLGIHTWGDLLSHVPFRYDDASGVTAVAELKKLEKGQPVTIHARVWRVSSHLTRQRLPITTVRVIDVADVAASEGEQMVGDLARGDLIASQESVLDIVFFRQPYVKQQLHPEKEYAFTGKIGRWQGRPTLSNPRFEPLDQAGLHTGRVLGVYPQHEGITSTWLRRKVQEILHQHAADIPEYLPDNIRKKHNLVERPTAWYQAHFPDTVASAQAARRRLAFDEIWHLLHRLDAQRHQKQQRPAMVTLTPIKIEQFNEMFLAVAPFTPSPTQNEAMRTVDKMLQQGYPGQLIVQGEVGSGKTLVAAYALLAVAAAGQQAAYLAPTTVLAQQHYEIISELAKHWQVETALWTSANQERKTASIIVGTHALLNHANLQPSLIVVDEEHRFGVAQREHFQQHHATPHLVTMTATPIPRTLAHILYADQEVAFLDLIPGKERTITTRVVPDNKIAAHWQWLGTQINQNAAERTQAFVIAPFIDASEHPDFANVYDANRLFTEAEKFLLDINPNINIALLTGRTPATQKEKILGRMRAGEIDVLVATPVIEVGIDIPQANVISIFSAERFGLAQLHQLRGRVGRAGQASWCFLLPSPGAGAGAARMRPLTQVSNGAELAEIDLRQRGAGDFLGLQQSGLGTLQFSPWLDLDLLRAVKKIRSHMTNF